MRRALLAILGANVRAYDLGDESTVLCWKTGTSNTSSVCGASPIRIACDGVGHLALQPAADRLIAGLKASTAYAIGVDVVITDPLYANLASSPHLNVHSCFSQVSFCSPFVDITPDLATSTPEVDGALIFDDNTTLRARSVGSNLSASYVNELVLDEGTYSVIVHAAWTTGEWRYDIALGRLGVVVHAKPQPPSNIWLVIVAGAVLGGLWLLVLRLLTRYRNRRADAVDMKDVVISAEEKEVVDSASLAPDSCRAAALEVSRAVFVLALYLGLGSLCYVQLLEPEWSAVDAVYFCMVTCSTVGYGDLAPSSTGSRIFSLLMILAGIVVVFPVASGAVSRLVLDPLTLKMRSLLDARFPNETVDVDGDGDADYQRPSHVVLFYLKNLLPSFALSLLINLLAASAFVAVEGLDFGSALYHCLITSTTVGYGDVALTSDAAKILAIVQIFFACVMLTELLSTLSAAVRQRARILEHHKLANAKLTARLFAKLLQHADTLRAQTHGDAHGDAEHVLNASLDQNDFLLAMLLETGIVTQDQLHIFIRMFRRGDETGNGSLDAADLTRLAAVDTAELAKIEARNSRQSKSRRASMLQGSSRRFGSQREGVTYGVAGGGACVEKVGAPAPALPAAKMDAVAVGGAGCGR